MEPGHGGTFDWQEGARHAQTGWWGGPLHFVVFLLILALLVGGVVWLVRRLAPSAATRAGLPAAMPPPALAADPAVAALRLRYARGEVSREEFRQTMADLTGAEAETDAWPGSAPGEETTPAV